MKKLLWLLAVCLMLAGCGNTRVVDGVRYDVFGLANEAEKRNSEIEYRVSIGSVIMAVLFSETLIIPIYVVLFDLWEPVGPMPAIKGQVLR